MIAASAADEEGTEFQKAINQYAEPKIHHCSQVHSPGAVLRRRREVRRKGEIEAVAEQDGDQTLQPFDTRRTHRIEGCLR